MKKLFIPLTIIVLATSSFTTKDSNEVDDTFDCYSSCDTYANAIGYAHGLTPAQEFQAFQQCYDANCGGNTGLVTFPGGNEQ